MLYVLNYLRQRRSIIPVNRLKPLHKLDIANSLAYCWIHQGTHCFSKSVAVVNVMIAIQIEEKTEHL
jgi:hypothetical protein